MWSNYHKLICSSSFRDNWIGVLGQSCPTLSQFLSRKMFDDLVLLLLPLSSKETTTAIQPELTASEENALRYAAGYVVHAVQNKVKKRKDPMREAMLYGLSDMSQSDGICDSSETWLNTVDRGGLTHINHTTFKMFHAVEMELRQHLTIANVQDMDQKWEIFIYVKGRHINL